MVEHATSSTSEATPGRARVALLLAVIACLVAAAGCGGSGSGDSGGSSAKSNTLVIANAVNVDTLDPAANSVNESIWMTQNIYSGCAAEPNGTKISRSWRSRGTSPRTTRRIPSTSATTSSRMEAGDGRGCALLDRALDPLQGRLGLPAHAGQVHHRARPQDGRDHALPAARAAAGGPGHVRLLRSSPRSWSRRRARPSSSTRSAAAVQWTLVQARTSEIDLSTLNPHYYGTKPNIRRSST